MFGDVPICVMVPPIREPKASGIRYCETGLSRRSAAWIATGMNTPNAPTFFTNADMNVTAPVSALTCSVVESKTRSTRRMALSITPDSATARLTTSTDAMMMITELEKPLNALSAGTTPHSTAAERQMAATRS